MNLTPEPIRWFDLVTACGLTDVRATSIHDMLTTLYKTNGMDGTDGGKMPTVRETAEMLIPRFGEVYKRDIKNVRDGGEDELVELCEKAEEAAVQHNRGNGGWPTEPDLTKRL
jgi:lipoyl(octanoyl) transferase